MNDTELLTVEQAAAYLQVQPESVRRYLRKGWLTGKRVVRQWRITRSSLEAFVTLNSEHEQRQPQEQAPGQPEQQPGEGE